MSSMPDTSRWAPMGETSNTRYFEIERGVLAALPFPGSVDDEASARLNMEFQLDYLRRGQRGVVIVFSDTPVSQDKGARSAYQTVPDPRILLGTALVGGNLLSRAMGSFFMGLSKPKVPVKMFPAWEQALVWAHERMASAEEPSR